VRDQPVEMWITLKALSHIPTGSTATTLHATNHGQEAGSPGHILR